MERMLFVKISNKVLSLALVIALLSFSFSMIAVYAADYSNNGITYSDTGVSNELKISAVSSTVRGKVVIPETVNGKKVVEITSDAFKDNLAITSIELPDSIKTVRASAFKGCAALVSVKFNGPVNTFKESVFSGCSSLSEIIMPSNMNMIPKETFFGCTSLKSFIIQPTVKTIGTSAFENCNSLAEIVIPKSVNKINEKAFHACRSLKSIVVEEGNETYKSVNSSLLTIDGTEFITYSCGLSQSVFNVPDGVTDIDYGAFAYSDIAKINLPDSILTIGDYAFQYCEVMSSINIPQNTESIGSHAFENCKRLKRISIPASVTEYTNAFVGSGLTTLVIEDGSKAVSEHAFEGCSQLKRVVLPDSVESIGTAAFYLCSGLETVIIPSSVTDIGLDAFKDCNSVLLYVEDPSFAEDYAIENNIDFEIIVGDKTEVGICVDKLPDKLMYKPGDEIDYTGISVCVVLANGNVVELSSDKYECVCGELGDSGDYTVTVSYKNFSDTFEVKVAHILGLSLNRDAIRTAYHIGEKFDKTGLKVYLEYSSGDLLELNDYTINCPEFDKSGTFEVTVNYNDYSSLIEVNVSGLKSIRIASKPSKTEYNYKEELNPSGLKVVAVYDDDTESELSGNAYILENTRFTQVGTASINVKYEDKTASFDVNVKYAWWQIIIRIVLFGFLWY